MVIYDILFVLIYYYVNIIHIILYMDVQLINILMILHIYLKIYNKIHLKKLKDKYKYMNYTYRPQLSLQS